MCSSLLHNNRQPRQQHHFSSRSPQPPTSNQHDADGEDLLGVGVGRHVAEAHAGQAAEGEVQRRHVLVPDGRTRPARGVVVRLPQLVAQRVQPANPRRA